MALYFFDIRRQNGLYPDTEGVDLAGLNDAKRQACLLVQALIEAGVDPGEIEVFDNRRRLIFIVETGVFGGQGSRSIH